MKALIVSAALLLLVQGCKHVESAGRLPPVAGMVTDSGGEPLAGVVIAIIRADQRFSRDAPTCEVITRNDGRFVCDVLRDKDWKPVYFDRRKVYEIEFKLPGFNPIARKFEYNRDIQPFRVELVDVLSDVPVFKFDEGQKVLEENVPDVEEPLPGG